MTPLSLYEQYEQLLQELINEDPNDSFKRIIIFCSPKIADHLIDFLEKKPRDRKQRSQQESKTDYPTNFVRGGPGELEMNEILIGNRL